MQDKINIILAAILDLQKRVELDAKRLQVLDKGDLALCLAEIGFAVNNLSEFERPVRAVAMVVKS